MESPSGVAVGPCRVFVFDVQCFEIANSGYVRCHDIECHPFEIAKVHLDKSSRNHRLKAKSSADDLGCCTGADQRTRYDRRRLVCQRPTIGNPLRLPKTDLVEGEIGRADQLFEDVAARSTMTHQVERCFATVRVSFKRCFWRWAPIVSFVE